MANKELKTLIHPYLFILEEGKRIREDMLDFRLRMLHIRCFEVIKAPKKTLSSDTINALSALPEEAKPLRQFHSSE